MTEVVVVGLGYVGLPVAVLAQRKGFMVDGIDNDSRKIDIINAGRSPLIDSDLESALEQKPFQASSNFDAVKNANIVIIAVPTPVVDNLPDLTILKNACRSVAKKIQKNTLVVIESTINPGVCDDELIPIFEDISGCKDGETFFLAHCPERISPGDKWHLKDINRVVGSNSDKGLDLAVEFYETLLDAKIKPMDTIKEAEAVKVVENSFRDVNIAFVNELAMSFDRMGINLENVIDGATTKPFGYMPFRPGPGVGGHCIPVDPYYLIEYAKSFDFEHEFLQLARKINNSMPGFTVDLTKKSLGKKNIDIKGSRIVLLGLSYKANIDDDRESPSYSIKRLLESEGARVATFDPFTKNASDFDSLESAISSGADAVVVATDHDVFNDISPAFLEANSIKVLVDTRNMFKDSKNLYKESGIIYQGIGQC